MDTNDLIWDQTLADGAQTWAQELLVKGGMQHAETSAGENIYYYKSIAKAPCVDASISW